MFDVIVKRIVERVTPVENFLVLMKMDYYNCATLMGVMLQARGLWTAVNEGTFDYTEDCMALEVISKVVPVEMMGSISSKPSAKATCESIILCNIGVDRVCKAKASTLMREFDFLAFLHGESVDDFNARIS
jgi:hypothetical protein